VLQPFQLPKPSDRTVASSVQIWAERLLVMAQAKADAQKLTNATFRQADRKIWAYSMIRSMP